MVGHVVELAEKKQMLQPRSRELMRVQDVSYTNFLGKRLLHKVSFSLPAGRILGIAGVEGNGQNELSELITGLRGFNRGDITI